MGASSVTLCALSTRFLLSSAPMYQLPCPSKANMLTSGWPASPSSFSSCVSASSSSFSFASAVAAAAVSSSSFSSSSLTLSPSKLGFSAVAKAALRQGLLEIESPARAAPDDGPVEFKEDLQLDSLEEMSPLRIAASVVLTGAIGFFLFRSLRKRAKFARETKLRSSGDQKVKSKEIEAALNMPKLPEVASRPAPAISQTLLGALISGAIALVLYKFTTTVEAGFAGKPVSADYTVRQLTITIRTIVNGLCYLATFVFTANFIGLTLYSLQLALNLGPSEPEPPKGGENRDKKVGVKALETTDEITEEALVKSLETTPDEIPEEK